MRKGERKKMAAKRMTLHSGRYNASPKHNDRTFDLEKADHIDIGRLDENYYWECASGKTSKGSPAEDFISMKFRGFVAQMDYFLKNMHDMTDAEIQRRSNAFMRDYDDIRAEIDEIGIEMD